MTRQTPTLVIAGIVLAAFFWVAETILHYLLFEPQHGFELWPRDANELWMRSFIFVLLVLFSVYAQIVTNRRLRVEREKLITFKATMNTVMDIEGNFLNNLTLFQMELEETHSLSDASILRLQELIRNTHGRLQDVANIEKFSEEFINGNIPVIRPR